MSAKTWHVIRAIAIGIVIYISAATLNSAAGKLLPPEAVPLPEHRSLSLPNVIFIGVDALRSDHVSSYGYVRPTTPNLDSWITNQGLRFADFTTNAAWTYPSNAAMLTGRFPSTINLLWTGPTTSRVPDPEKLLAEYMHDAGYYTAGFTSAEFASRELGYAQGYDTFQELIRPAPTRTLAAEVNALAFNWLGTTWTTSLSGTQPLFLYLYYFDPHTYYDSPAPYDTLFDSTYTGTVTADVYEDGVAVSNGTLTLTPRDVEHVIALYDGEIAYWDNYLGQMLTRLNQLGLLNNSLIVVTSDHGQMFGEHAKWTHRNSVYEEVLRVPLVMRYTGVITAGLVVTAPAQSVDIVPTMLAWLNKPLPANLDGSSLKEVAQGGPISVNRAIVAEMNTDLLFPNDPLPPHVPLRSLKQADWKLIHPVGQQWAEELYQVQIQSLYETDNVIQTQPGVANPLRQVLIDQYHLPVVRLYLPHFIK